MLPAIAYLFIVAIVRGIANLDAVHAAECLEQSVVLIGIIMIVPINAAEQSKALQEVVCTKKIQQWVILLIRLIMSLLILSAMTGLFAGIMKWNNCKFPYIPYVAGTLISEIALGSVGLFAALLSNSVVIGYLVSVGYFMFNVLGDISRKNVLCLFTMGTGDYVIKVWLMGISAVLIATLLVYKKRKKCY